jgi:translation initiation factor 2 subunit 3
LVGNIAGKPDTLPPVQDTLVMEIHLMERIVGSDKMQKVKKIEHNESLMLNVGTTVTVGKTTSVRKDSVEVKLLRPVASRSGDRVAVSRQIERWSLIGYGILQ